MLDEIVGSRSNNPTIHRFSINPSIVSVQVWIIMKEQSNNHNLDDDDYNIEPAELLLFQVPECYVYLVLFPNLFFYSINHYYLDY